jgi:hypothetical protein
LEILVAIAITAVIFSLVYGSFSTSFSVSDRIMEDREFYRTVRVTLSRMIHELESAYWNPDEEGTLLMGSHAQVDGYPRDSVRFTSLSHYRRGAENRESDLNLLRYYLEEDRGHSTLLLFHEEEVNLFSLTPKTQQVFELGERLKGLEFKYYDGKEWVENWDSTERRGLPKAIEINLVLEDIQGREREFTTKTTLGLVQ